MYGCLHISDGTIIDATGTNAGTALLLSSSTAISSVLIRQTNGVVGVVHDDSGTMYACVASCLRAENATASPRFASTATGAATFNALDCIFSAEGLDDITVIMRTETGNRNSIDAGCRADFDRDGDIDHDDSDHELALIGSTGWGLPADLGDDADDHLEAVALPGTSCD